ncbi:putative immunity protein [Streptomyces venezuelae]|uniref:putative immunity protein n=1 Tax=Streptomyces venezuelae TaxID=54571 RepID=UPI003451DA82
MILPKVHDPRLITLRRGGTLTDSDHRLLALWAAACAEHVLPLFESARPSDPRPREAIEQIRAWVRGGIKMSESRAAAPRGQGERAGRLECRWQRDQLPGGIRKLVLDDQRLRNEICWSVFDC